MNDTPATQDEQIAQLIKQGFTLITPNTLEITYPHGTHVIATVRLDGSISIK